MTNLAKWYSVPKCMDALDVDHDKSGAPSDHLMVVYTPLNNVENKRGTKKRKITFRPYTDVGFELMQHELENQSWDFLINEIDVNKQLETFHDIVLSIRDSSFPEKTRVVTSQNQPWYNDDLVKLRRKKSREFYKHRMSKKYFELEKRYQKLLHQCKKTYFKSKMSRLKSSGGKQWWKEINNIIDNKNEDIEVEEIMNYSPQQQVEICFHFTRI